MSTVSPVTGGNRAIGPEAGGNPRHRPGGVPPARRAQRARPARRGLPPLVVPSRRAHARAPSGKPCSPDPAALHDTTNLVSHTSISS